MLDVNDDYQRHPLSVGGFDQLDATARRALAAVEGIPQAILFGDPPSGLNTDGSSSRKTMADLTSTYQTSTVEPMLRELYTRIFRGMGMSEEQLADMAIVFHPVEEQTELEAAQVRISNAQADQIYENMGAIAVDDVNRALVQLDDRYAGSEVNEDAVSRLLSLPEDG